MRADYKSSLDYKKMEVITDILDIENNINALEDYLSNLNNDKLQIMFDNFKERLGVKDALEYLTIVMDLCGYNISKELLEGLLNDDELVEFINKSKNKEGIVSKLKEVLDEDSKSTKDDDEDLSNIEEEIKNEKLDANSSDIIAMGNFPLYNDEEEKEAFKKYDEKRRKLEAYLEARMHIPAVADFKDFIENRYVDSKDGIDRSKTKDPFIVKTIMALYGRPILPKDQPLVELKKDQNIVDMIEDMRELRDDICYHNMRLAISVAKKYMDRGVPLNDLIQEGSIGLNKAIDKFDPSKGFRFSTFAVNWIKQAVTRALMNDGSVIRIPVHLSGVGNKVEKAKRILRNEEFIEDPSIDEIFEKCKDLGFDLTLAQVKNYIKASLISDPVSANKPVGEEEDSELIDFIPSTAIESPEEYAEYQGLHDKVISTVSDISSGKIQKTRNESVQRTYTYKKVIFKTLEGKLITIILSPSEYNRYMRNLNAEDGRERFTEFVKKYGLNPDKLTSEIKKENITFTKDQREALIYSIRRGLIDDFARMFIAGRNYNNVLFDDNENNKDYTLQKVGYLFEVTRERIRQIESRCSRKVERAFMRSFESDMGKLNQDFVIKHLFEGDPLKTNVYNVLNIIRKEGYVGSLSKPGIVSIDQDGNILPLKEGTVSIVLRNLTTGDRKELRVVVDPLTNESVDPITEFMNKKAEEKTLKLINETNKKDNQ